MIIETKRLRLERVGTHHAQALRDYYDANHAHLEAWEPIRPPEAKETSFWENWAAEKATLQEGGAALSFLAFEHNSDSLVAVCNFSNIVRGVFQACHLGYSVAAMAQGRGIMSETVAAGLDHVFTNMGLHRVMANYIPENVRSARLLERLGFEKEGFARDYLYINGQWRDHVLTSKISPHWNYLK